MGNVALAEQGLAQWSDAPDTEDPRPNVAARKGPPRPAAQGLLAEWRLLDLEASPRRDLWQFEAALDLLRRALAAAPAVQSTRTPFARWRRR